MSPIVSVSPIALPVAGRPVDLELRVTAPLTGDGYPIVLLSHGHGPSNDLSSLDGYAPIAQHLAASGFVVIQPTHLDSKRLGLRDSDHAEAPLFWRSRATDMSRVLDSLDAIASDAPPVAHRWDASRVAVLGHSMGGHTASVLLGARHDVDGEVLADPRIRAGVLLAAPGGGDGLSEFAAEHYPFFASIDLSTMATPALVVAGDSDGSPHLTTRGAEWHMEPFTLAPGPKALATIAGGEHGLGGVSGWDAAETTDENPERVTTVLRVVTAYLRSELGVDGNAWDQVGDTRGATVRTKA